MKIEERKDGMGWDVIVSTENGTTTRSIIKENNSFIVVNPFKINDGSKKFITYNDAVYAAENLLI